MRSEHHLSNPFVVIASIRKGVLETESRIATNRASRQVVVMAGTRWPGSAGFDLRVVTSSLLRSSKNRVAAHSRLTLAPVDDGKRAGQTIVGVMTLDRD